MTISLREVCFDDAELLFHWQLHDHTRRYFFNTKKPTHEEHMAWLKASLENNHRFLLLGEINADPIGVLRYDVSEDKAEVSVYIDPVRHANGLGSKLLNAGNAWVKSHLKNVAYIEANIKSDNRASQKCFQKAGFSEFSSTFHFKI